MDHDLYGAIGMCLFAFGLFLWGMVKHVNETVYRPEPMEHQDEVERIVGCDLNL